MGRRKPSKPRRARRGVDMPRADEVVVPPGVDLVEESDALFAEFARLDTVSLDEFHTWRARVGRVNGPALLFDAWYGNQIEADTVIAVIGSVWSDAEYPDQCLERVVWRELFVVAGFTVDGQPAERPARPVELWRGSVPGRRTDWSWTTDRKVAEHFATGVRGRKPGHLYRLIAPPEALLCANTERDEAEYVVDTAGLIIACATEIGTE